MLKALGREDVEGLAVVRKGSERQREYYQKNRVAIAQRYEIRKEAIQEKQREYRFKNREALRKLHRGYYEKNKQSIAHFYLNNKEAIRHQQSLYRLNNKEKIKALQKNYRTQNKLKIKQNQLEYALNNKDYIRQRSKYYRLKYKLYIEQYYRKNQLKIKEQARLYRLKHKKQRTRRTWTDLNQIRSFFEFAMDKLFVTDPNDWYRISRTQISQVGGLSLFNIFGNLGKALQFVFPEVNWDQSKFSFRGKKSTQRWLKVMLQQILPETDVIEDFLHPQLFWDDQTKSRMELDIWIPKFEIALEYQGEHHYHDLCSAYGPSGTVSLYSKRDEKKKETCLSKGITLITIPYWWDGKKESLCSTLHHIHPDIFPQTNFPPIPISPPNKNDLKHNEISTFLMLGQEWNRSQDITGWIISEKLDGFRAFWNGSKLFSKTGNILPAPWEFTGLLPHDVCLDGELWIGYDNFNIISSIIRKSTHTQNNKTTELWKSVKYCVFDAPMHPGNYVERHSFLSNSISGCGPNISVVPITHCLGFYHLQTILNEITKKKGEGVMLYHPSSKYTSGRTNNLLKVKPFFEEDVKFLECNPNSYSFLCEQQNGENCVVKCSGWDYLFPPSPGTVLTVNHSGILDTSHKLKHPFLLRVRNDLHWDRLKTQMV